MTETDELVEFDEAIGRIQEYDADTGRARILVEQGNLQVGDLIRIMGAASDDDTGVLTIQDLIMATQEADDPSSLVVEVPVPRPVNSYDDVFLVREPGVSGTPALSERILLSRAIAVDPDGT